MRTVLFIIALFLLAGCAEQVQVKAMAKGTAMTMETKQTPTVRKDGIAQATGTGSRAR
jgi:uncharacterized lipoprotein YajG